MPKVIFDSVVSKLLGPKLAMRLGLAVEVVEEGREVSDGISRPSGRSHEGQSETTVSEDRSSARVASKSNSMREEWERFREAHEHGRGKA